MEIPDPDDVRRALAAPDDEITVAEVTVLRAAAEGGLAHEAALGCAVAELRAYPAGHGIQLLMRMECSRPQRARQR